MPGGPGRAADQAGTVGGPGGAGPRPAPGLADEGPAGVDRFAPRALRAALDPVRIRVRVGPGGLRPLADVEPLDPRPLRLRADRVPRPDQLRALCLSPARAAPGMGLL